MSIQMLAAGEAISLEPVTGIQIGITKNLENIVFTDGNDAQLDHGMTEYSLTLTGLFLTDHEQKTLTLNTLMDNQYTIILTGLSDTRLNTSYIISSLTIHQIPGPDRYSYSIIFERLYDE